MLVRLLLAVLTVAGPMPVGVCTCAAARGPALSSAQIVVMAPAAGPVKSCGCQRHATEATRAAVGGEGLGHADGCAEQPARHDHHDRDCPAVNPRASNPTGITTPTADLPADSCPALPATLDAQVCCRPSPPPRPATAGPTIPLFLSHCSLRI